MKERAEQNLGRSLHNDNENWASSRLAQSGLKWKRQAQWGARIFDFWNHEKGIAVEIDGAEHRPDYDAARDRYNFLRSAIVVIRVRNRNEDDMQSALVKILEVDSWRERRERMGLNGHTKKERRAHVDAAGLKVAHGKW
jgi:very-short-patch-repair endonuclease